jgi:uncharacterized protein (UPF0264 family)
MSGLLVSVRNVEEAEAALAGGADLIDIKEPLHGSLGAASAEVCEAIQLACRRFNERRNRGQQTQGADQPAGFEATPRLSSQRRIASTSRIAISVALGELDDGIARFSVTLLRDFDYAKIGLSHCRARSDWLTQWRSHLQSIPANVTRVAVVYADWRECNAPDPRDIVRQADNCGCAVILFDTYDKTHGDLLTHFSLSSLTAFSDEIRQRGLRFVLGGSLSAKTIAELAPLKPDFFAVRGAACSGTRTDAIDKHRVRMLSQQINSLAERRTAIAERCDGSPRFA